MKNILYSLVVCAALSSCNLTRTNFIVVDEGMLPTLHIDDHIKITRNIDSLTYGDIVFIDLRGNSPLLYDTLRIEGYFASRIVALPGDSVAVENGLCVINGKANKPKYLQSMDGNSEYEELFPNNIKIRIYTNSMYREIYDTDMKSMLVPDNHYFLVSDNRTIAIDSRMLGAIPKENIVGKVIRIKKQE